MKKVSELINLKNLLLDAKWKISVEEISENINTLKSDVEFVNSETGVDNSDLISILTDIQSKSEESVDVLNDYITNIDSLIREYDGDLRETSVQIDQASNTDPPKQILTKISNRESTHHNLTASLFAERCKLYSNWEHPGMHIRPGYGTWSRNLVDLDPLYLVDTHRDLLEPSKSIFNDHYQSRLRFKVISDIDKPIFEQFPKNQFGLIVATEFFNQKSLGTIKRYLSEIFSLLKEGGAFIFTFNDCDFPEGARNSENSYDCYTPGKEVKEIAKNIGFDIIDRINSNGTLAWLELRRPGTLNSLRGGQTLARIKHNHENN